MTTGPISLRQDWQHTDGKAHMRLVDSYDPVEGVTKIAMMTWDTNALAWVRYTPGAGGGGAGTADSTAANQVTEISKLTSIDGKLPALMSAAPGSDSGQAAIPVRVISQLGAGTGGGGGGAVTIADGADVTLGAKADTAWDGVTASPTLIAIQKYVAAKLDAVRVLLAGTLITTTTQLPASLGGNGGLKIEGVASGTPIPVTNASLPLPSGASTGAKQDTGNASLASLDGKLPPQGQAVAANSTPVVLPVAQVAALTPPAAITGFALEAGHLAAIDTATARLPAQGQALAAGSLPVVLPVAQVTTLTPPAAITGFALDATVAKDGTDITGASIPAGGVGIRGWLSAIYTKLAASIAVTGTFWQTTQPVSIAAAVAVTGAFWQTTQPVSIAATLTTDVADRAGRLVGVVSNANIDVALSTRLKPADTLSKVATLDTITNALPAGTNLIGQVVPVTALNITHKGRAQSFRIPGRAGTAGQKLMSLHNATGSSIKVDIEQIAIDCVQLAVIAVTVLPPIIRVYKVTVLPTNGNTVTKVSRDSTFSASSGSVTILQDASADGTNSTTALTATIPGGAVITQEFAPRLITAAGYEMFDRVIFLESSNVTLNPLEGIVVMLDYTLATQNPTSTHWLVGCEWNEHT